MKLGRLETLTDEMINEAKAKKQPLSVGIEPQSLLDDLHVNLMLSGYDAKTVLQNLERELMLMTGLVEEKKEADK